ncbi:MFS transporter [Nocardioides jensenii]|uniref:MFS transporter n=1 Tax=Nocardioides jensenii TaxID=1843 RepID=UPI00082D130A|nr:MFS transporter [Nocardioides jensenii]
MSEMSVSETVPEVPPPVSKAEKKRLAWALVLISLAQLMVVLDSTIANIALPFIGEDLHINEANLTWIVTGYALAFGGLLLLGGRLGDLYGRRRIFMIGVVVFAIASLLGGIAWTEPLLLSSRALQGVGAAMASPAALALITTTFPAGPQRNRAFAVYAAMSGIGAAVGLILGGWLTGLDQPLGVDGWRLTFLINVPIGLIAASMAPRFFDESEKHEGWLDIPGAITGTFGLLGLVYGFSRAGDERYGWGDTWTIASLAAGVALLVFFAVIESRVKHPLLPVRVFAHRTRAVSFIAMMILPAAMFAMFFFLSLFVQNVVGYSPLHAGFAFLPFSVGMIISATLASNLISRIDPRILAGTGSLVAAAALFGFSRLSVDESPSNLLGVLQGDAVGAGVNYWTQILPFVFLMALGMGMVFVPLTLTAVHHLRAQDSGVGSGVLNTMQQVGGALGLAVLATVSLHFSQNRGEEIAPGLVKAARGAGLDQQLSPDKFHETMGQLTYLGSFTDGATTAFLVGSAMMLAASVIIWLFLDVKHEELATDGPEVEAPVHVG